MSGLLVNDYSQRNPPSLGEAMTGLLGSWGGNIEQGLLSALPVLAENDPYKIGQQLLREGAGVGGIAWHGSPHKFLKPDLSKIGTGEGAQAYGHGFYSAEARGVGEEYRDKLSEYTYRTPSGEVFDPYSEGGLTNINVRATLGKHNGDVDAAISRAEDLVKSIPDTDGGVTAAIDLVRLKELRDAGGLTTDKGHLYKMNIPDETIDKMLDWDKPLSEQSEYVKGVISKSDNTLKNRISTAIDSYGEADVKGNWLYGVGVSDLMASKGVSQKDSQQAASEYLNSLGIPGIKYLDGNSRAAGQGSRNFVSFTPDHIEMLERNGVPMKGLLGE